MERHRDFIAGENPDYIEENFDEVAIENLGLTLLAILDSDGEPVWIHARDDRGGDGVPRITSVINSLPHDDLLREHSTEASQTSGVWQSPWGPMAVSSLPVLDSNYRGPIAGTMITGRLLGPEALAHLSGQIEVAFHLHAARAPAVPDDVLRALRLGQAQTVTGPGDQQVSSYRLLNDVYGDPAYVLESKTDRSVMHAGVRAVTVGLLG